MWSRVDDGVPTHPKFLRAGPVASWLWLCGVCYCNKHLTDGFIPEAALPMIGPIPDLQKNIDTLIEVCLWERTKGGFQVHHFHDHNDTRAEALARQDVNREQRRKAGIASGESRRRNANAPLNENRTAPLNENRTAPLNEMATTGVQPRPVPSRPEESTKEPEIEIAREAETDRPEAEGLLLDEAFEQLRDAYPPERRQDSMLIRQEFIKAFRELKNGQREALFLKMHDSLAGHKRSEQWKNIKHIPMFGKWISENRWIQTLPETANSPPPKTYTSRHDKWLGHNAGAPINLITRDDKT